MELCLVTLFPSLGRFGVPLVASLILAGCGDAGGGARGGGAQGANPPPLVEVITVQSQAVPNIVELPGRIQAVRLAEVRARVDGIVERRLYQEGTDVAAGDPLFRIDPRDMTAQSDQARAALRRAEAARLNARQIVSRFGPLVSDKSVSAMEYDQAQANLRQAEASVDDARATLARTQLQLGYTLVRAPIAGRVGSAQVTEGALVSAGSATLMTTVDQLSPVYAVFTQSSAAVLDLLDAQRTGTVDVPALSQIEVKLILANGREYGPTGRLDFAAQTVDPSTGSQTLRAVFPNDARLLLPGQFVRGRISLGTLPQGIMIPAQAVQMGQNTAVVSVVGRDMTVASRTVQLGNQSGGHWIVLSGLKPGERVIIAGWQKVQPGQPVRVKGDARATTKPQGGR
jgi:membrane fusion protein (multidrug efflux system)